MNWRAGRNSAVTLGHRFGVWRAQCNARVRITHQCAAHQHAGADYEQHDRDHDIDDDDDSSPLSWSLCAAVNQQASISCCVRSINSVRWRRTATAAHRRSATKAHLFKIESGFRSQPDDCALGCTDGASESDCIKTVAQREARRRGRRSAAAGVARPIGLGRPLTPPARATKPHQLVRFSLPLGCRRQT